MRAPYKPRRLWEQWYFDQLHRPMDKPKREWVLTTVLANRSYRHNVNSFYQCVPPPSEQCGWRQVEGHTADLTRVRPPHLWFLKDDLPSHLFIGIVYQIRGIRSLGGLQVGGRETAYAMGIFNPRPDDKYKKVATVTVVSEEGFRTTVEQACTGLPADAAVEMEVALNMLYYCGIRSGSLSKLLWSDIVRAGDTTMLWWGRGLLVLPPHIVALLSMQKRVYKRKKKDAIFSQSISKKVRRYRDLALTLRALKSMRG